MAACGVCSPTASGRGPFLVTAQKLPLRQRAPRDPRPTVRAFDLWGSVLAGLKTPDCGGLGQGQSGSGPSLGTGHVLARSTSEQTGTEAPSNRPTTHTPHPVREPPDAIHRPHQVGALFSIPPRNCHSASKFHQTRCPAFGTAPARGPREFRHRGTSGRPTPTSAHAPFRAEKG